MTDFKLYTLQRKAVCRGCDYSLDKGTEVLHTYTIRGKGMHIYICKQCVSEMQDVMKESET